MRIAWKLFRALVSVLLLLAVLLPAAIYVLLSLDPVQNKVRDIASAQLTELLGADVGIGRVRIYPFSRLSINDISLSIEGDTVAKISTVSAGFKPLRLIAGGDLVINYALLDGVDLKVARDSLTAPLNIQPVLDRLKSDKSGEQKFFELEISTVILRRCRATYDVLDAPEPDSCRFDPRHIAISDLAVNAYIPKLSNATYCVELDHLSFVERSGFTLDKLSMQADIEPDKLLVSDLTVALPASRLAFDPLSVSYESLKDIPSALRSAPVDISTRNPSYVYPPDLQAFVPVLAKIDRKIDIVLAASLGLDDIDLRLLRLKDEQEAFALALRGDATAISRPDELTYHLTNGILTLDAPKVGAAIAGLAPRSDLSMLGRAGHLTFDIEGAGSLSQGKVALKSRGDIGNVNVDGTYRRVHSSTDFTATVNIEDLDVDVFTGGREPIKVSADINAQGRFRGGKPTNAKADIDINSLLFKGYRYDDLHLWGRFDNGNRAEVNIDLRDPNATLLAYALYDASADKPTLLATATLNNANLNLLGFDKGRPGFLMSSKLIAKIDNADLKRLSGNVDINDFAWVDGYDGLRCDRISLSAFPDHDVPEITLASPIINGSLRGDYDFPSLVESLKAMTFHFMPALEPLTAKAPKSRRSDVPLDNDFVFDFTIEPNENVTHFFNLPISPAYVCTLTGKVDSSAGYADFEFAAPYLHSGDKIIEHTSIFGRLDLTEDKAMIYATTQMPTKKGDMNVAALINAKDNVIDTRLDWGLDRRIPLNGRLDFQAELFSSTTPAGSLSPVEGRLSFMPGTINFGDALWRISPSEITVQANRISIDNFALEADNQSVKINGTAGNAPTDSVLIVLDNVSLLPIFETLEINNALIGGRAKGVFAAKSVVSSKPSLECPRLHVDSIGYNRCPIGNADVAARWDNESKSFYLDADIEGFEGRRSHIYGDIYPMNEALDINFDADSVPVGFLKPFMEAFARDISGRASGHCRLFGTFKDIDLEGDVFADNVKLAIDFTNTSYIATDSVHIRPGRIELNNTLIRDVEGHTARLSGVVGHTYFRQPTFKFDVTEARDLLSYNITSRQNPDWYGTIYGNGGATISGYPGVVNIGVDMTTAAKSTFTFVLSDRLDAEDYSFLTFRDVTPDSLRLHPVNTDDTPEIVRDLRMKLAQQDSESASVYNMDIKVNITPEADMVLVMDPVGGDEIKATGSGNLHLAYNSGNNDLNIWGKYRVQNGSYRFTLQDIIIREFKIVEGSEIQFDGDPYGVKTSLSAYYATNANLSDLDKSFQQDKDIARTNVPVHALMKVNGDIRQPELSFDLDFPTLTTDTYRKVRSIISTEDMMNRQIIYLLALNRFYTPDYMASTTKGSELFSVASSTISSQLGNMLGKLSDNWSIAPNLRSDRGDFSDVEVDVALNSRLLNNRLIFNGNFGYRDKTLNTNQFIGDFDVEYLLNRTGTVRLKAYNRYNDRNYYLRSALTTQGIGVMFTRDFDSLLSFLRKRPSAAKADTVPDENGASGKQ